LKITALRRQIKRFLNALVATGKPAKTTLDPAGGCA
jgi:hypothetical protein